MRKLIVFAALAALVDAHRRRWRRSATSHSRESRRSTKAGKAWTATVSVTIDKQPSAGRAPTIRLLNQLDQHRRHASSTSAHAPTRELGVYRARVAFPSAGTWRVVVIDRETDRAYSFGLTRVRAA